MPHIVLTEEQAQVVVEARGAVEVRDPQGRLLASLTPLAPEHLGRFGRKGEQGADAEQSTVLPSRTVYPAEAAELSMELSWNKARHKIRAGAREYSEQTHADY